MDFNISLKFRPSQWFLGILAELNEQYAGFAAALEDADTPPTRQHREMFQSLHTDLGVQLALWTRLQGGALADLQKQIAAR